jgi:hypothetical protein
MVHRRFFGGRITGYALRLKVEQSRTGFGRGRQQQNAK